MPAGRPQSGRESRKQLAPIRFGTASRQLSWKPELTYEPIQLLMGHAHLEHTTVYLHLSQRHLHAAPNPLDQVTVSTRATSKQAPKDAEA